MKIPVGTLSTARLRALGFIAACTLLGWAGAIAGHRAETLAIRAALILAVVACGIAVFFTSLALARHDITTSDRRPFYSWRMIPVSLAIAPMATLFWFDVSAAGIGLAVLAALIVPFRDPSYRLSDAMLREDARDAERFKFRSKILETIDTPDGDVPRAGKP